MPKGFNQKAIDGFTQWMGAVLSESGMEREKAKQMTEETKNLLVNGFPQVRKYA